MLALFSKSQLVCILNKEVDLQEIKERYVSPIIFMFAFNETTFTNLAQLCQFSCLNALVFEQINQFEVGLVFKTILP